MRKVWTLLCGFCWFAVVNGSDDYGAFVCDEEL